MDTAVCLDRVLKTGKTYPVTPIRGTALEKQAQQALEKIVMIFGGEYDLAGREHLRSDLERLTDVPDVVLDFTDVTYIDSTVVVELIRMHQMRDARGYKPTTFVVQKQSLKKLFALFNLQGIFRFVPKIDDVVENKEERIGLYYASRKRGEPSGGHASAAAVKLESKISHSGRRLCDVRRLRAGR